MEASLSSSSSSSTSSLSSSSLSSRAKVVLEVGDTFVALAIRQKWIMDDDDEISLEAPFNSIYCSMGCLVLSTLLAIQRLEEIEAFLSWQQDIASISS